MTGDSYRKIPKEDKKLFNDSLKLVTNFMTNDNDDKKRYRIKLISAIEQFIRSNPEELDEKEREKLKTVAGICIPSENRNIIFRKLNLFPLKKSHKCKVAINKALALGADYVMIGSLFGQLLESAADMVIESKDDAQYPATYNRSTGEVLYYTNYQAKNINIWNGNTEEEKRDFIRSTKSIKKRQIGMSTKEAQRAMSLALRNPVTLDPDKLKTSEGITTFIECKYTLKQWLNNMMDYLRSAMSYTNAFDLEEFKNRTDLIVNSPAEIQSVNK